MLQSRQSNLGYVPAFEQTKWLFSTRRSECHSERRVVRFFENTGFIGIFGCCADAWIIQIVIACTQISTGAILPSAGYMPFKVN